MSAIEGATIGSAALTRAAPTPGRLFSGFAVALGLSVLAGYLNFLRELPSGDFHAEWGALVFFCFAALLLAGALPRRFPVNPALLLVPAVLSLLLVVQGAIGLYWDWQTPAFWFGYLVIAVLAMVLGQGIRAAGLTSETVNRLAWSLVLAATLNALAQVTQVVFRVWDVAPFVVPLVTCRPYGNIGQSNQAATLAWLGLASVLYLRGTRRLPAPLSLPLIAVLLVSAALTASRMSWLLMAVTAAMIVGVPGWPVQGTRQRIVTAATLVCGFGVATVGVAGIFETLGPTCASGLDRLAARSDTGITLRLELWRQAVEVWKTNPWFGVGAFGFGATVYGIETLDVPRGIDQFVHNIVLHLLAEFGIIGAGALVLAVVLLVHRLVRAWRQLTATDGLLLLLLALIAVHSMLEYPLWYTYFVIPFSLALGLLVRPEWATSASPRSLRLPIVICASGLLVVSGMLFVDYRHLDRLAWMEIQRREMSVAATPEVRQRIEEALQDVRLFRYKAEFYATLSAPISNADLPASITATDRLLRRELSPLLMGRRAALAILAGDDEGARWHIRRMLGFFASDSANITEPLYRLVQQRPREFASLKPILDEELARMPKPRP